VRQPLQKSQHLVDGQLGEVIESPLDGATGRSIHREALAKEARCGEAGAAPFVSMPAPAQTRIATIRK